VKADGLQYLAAVKFRPLSKMAPLMHSLDAAPLKL
jgi:hypothetical protein